jgi:hypothetical protein
MVQALGSKEMIEHIDMVGVPPGKCLACGCRFDSAGSPGSKDGPTGGDMTICISCGHLMVFTEALRLRELTKEEQVKIADNGLMLNLQSLRARMLQ